MKLGYARVSTSEQDTAAQISALEAAGCERFYTDQASGARWDRPELQRLLTELRPDDTMVVWKLDRASRSLKDLLTLIDRIGEADAHFSSLTEHIDTGTPAGRMMLQMVGAFRRVRARDAARAHQGRTRAGPQGRPDRWSPPQTDHRAAPGRDPDGGLRRENRHRRRAPVSGTQEHGHPADGQGGRQRAQSAGALRPDGREPELLALDQNT